MFLYILISSLLFSQGVVADTLKLSIQDQDKNNFLNASYKLEQYFSESGDTEGLSSIWLDMFYEPRNINLMNYDDLVGLPNMNPIDAHAVIMQLKRMDQINDDFELKNSGISKFGYKNLVNFVNFNENSKDRFHFRYSSRISTMPILTSSDIEGGNVISYQSDSPERYHRLLTSYSFGKNRSKIKYGMVYKQGMGEEDVFTSKNFIELTHFPIYNTGFQIDHLVIGNFTASFGQGVVFQNSDYFSARRTGYGFSKRNDGICSDLTRTSQYVLNGGAIQISSSFLRITYFMSDHPRDAIINENKESFTALIVMEPRLPYGFSGNQNKIYDNLISSVNERTVGFNIRVGEGANYLGMTYYRSLYDKYLIPEPIETIISDSGDEKYLEYLSNSSDNEIAAMYQSEEVESIMDVSWDEAKSSREVVGVNFSSTINKIVFQGEYALIPSYTQRLGRLPVPPKAMVFNAYTEFNNINFLILYRNYDLQFDNPYQRSFSNYQRFKTTIFEDDFWLEDAVYSFLHYGNPQPQAEEGIYVSARYQIYRSIVLKYEVDTWNRKADNTKYYRTVFKFEWRPKFNYRVNIRQKWSGRGQFDLSHPSPFRSEETQISFELRLSNYDKVRLTVVRGYTIFSPRPRLTYTSTGGFSSVGDISSPDLTVGFSFEHNVDNQLSFRAGTIYIDGFVWIINDSDFMIFNSNAGAIHNWSSIRFRPTTYLSVNLKYSITDHFPLTTISYAQTETGSQIQNPLVNEKYSDYKIQVNYAF